MIISNPTNATVYSIQNILKEDPLSCQYVWYFDGTGLCGMIIENALAGLNF
jgi:hypothetical protein